MLALAGQDRKGWREREQVRSGMFRSSAHEKTCSKPGVNNSNGGYVVDIKGESHCVTASDYTLLFWRPLFRRRSEMLWLGCRGREARKTGRTGAFRENTAGNM